MYTTTLAVKSAMSLSSRPIEPTDRQWNEESDRRSNDERKICVRWRVKMLHLDRHYKFSQQGYTKYFKQESARIKPTPRSMTPK